MTDNAAGEGVVRTQALIVGAGISGLAQAVRMSEAGMDFLILEKADDVGGTWRENTYPGACCDIESHLYSFSHDPNPAWSSVFATQPEILGYLRGVAKRRGLLPRIRFGTRVTSARWDEQAGEWRISADTGQGYAAQFLVLGVGPLHAPSVPALPGADAFTGHQWHSSEWNHDVGLAGKRVALIGTGASGVQIAPHLARQASELTIFQRTPAWILPKADGPVPAWQQRVFRLLPWTQSLHRLRIYLFRERRGLGFHYRPEALRVAEPVVLGLLAAQVSDQDLRSKLTPDYHLGCKRVLFSNDFYWTVCRPNVRLVAGPAASLRPTAVVDASGNEHGADVVIYATGFDVTGPFDRIQIEGSGGRLLRDAWRDGPRAYHGMLVPGFPNMFILLGPGGASPYTSVIVNAEAQARYVTRAIRATGAAGGAALDVRPAAEQRFQEESGRRYKQTIWATGGCQSWYQTGTPSGSVLWPGSTVAYRRNLRKVTRDDFIFS